MWKHISAKKLLRSLVLHNDDPFEVLSWVGTVAYRLALSKRLMLHPVFHVSFMKKFYEDADPDRRKEAQASPEVRAQFDRELDHILHCRTRGTYTLNRRMEFLVL